VPLEFDVVVTEIPPLPRNRNLLVDTRVGVSGLAEFVVYRLTEEAWVPFSDVEMFGLVLEFPAKLLQVTLALPALAELDVVTPLK
jgi:hypothetical protein